PFPWGVGFGVALAILGALIYAIYGKEFGQRYSLRKKQESRAAYWFIFPWLFGIVIFTVGPMIFSLLMSFADWDIIQPARWRGFENYIEAFTTDTRVLISLRVTILFTIVSVPAGLVTALLMALLLNVKVKGIPLFRAFFYLPSLASAVAASLIWMRVFNPNDGLINGVLYSIPPLGDLLSAWAGRPDEKINWLNSEVGVLPALVIMGLWGVGGAMIIILAGLQGVPAHYYEAATLDGAGPWHKFKSVTLPLITPALFFCLITGFIGSFQTFTQAFIMTGGGPNDASLFFMLHLYRQAFESLRMGYASSLAWILFFLILAFTLLQLKANKWVYYEADAKS
ncbi:MAG: sugar ABC transporter permease, partial [Fimbriimonadaceae bacterium]|nr:sugar ABC transporter permease [Fimbriimonadaceae bacterium]